MSLPTRDVVNCFCK